VRRGDRAPPRRMDRDRPPHPPPPRHPRRHPHRRRRPQRPQPAREGSMTRPRIGALFAGYGGLDLAVENVFGATTAWVSEFDAAPSRILARRFPDAPNHGDVTRIDWATVEPVDIITGGSPCQDLSHAGKRAGMKAGTRSGLWASMCDAIETIRPRLDRKSV